MPAWSTSSAEKRRHNKRCQDQQKFTVRVKEAKTLTKSTFQIPEKCCHKGALETLSKGFDKGSDLVIIICCMLQLIKRHVSVPLQSCWVLSCIVRIEFICLYAVVIEFCAIKVMCTLLRQYIYWISTTRNVTMCMPCDNLLDQTKPETVWVASIRVSTKYHNIRSRVETTTKCTSILPTSTCEQHRIPRMCDCPVYFVAYDRPYSPASTPAVSTNISIKVLMINRGSHKRATDRWD